MFEITVFVLAWQALAAPILSPLHDENITSDQCEWARHNTLSPSSLFGCHRSF